MANLGDRATSNAFERTGSKTSAKGIVVLGYWDNGIRHVSNNKKLIQTPPDMKGMKIRTPPDAVTIDIMQALGAETQQIKFAELYVALSQGVVDGQENPLVNVLASKLYEVQKFTSLTGHKFEMNPFLMSKRTWDKLSEADRKIISDAAAEATQLQRRLSKEADEKAGPDLESKGVKINKIDRAAFAKATESVTNKYTSGRHPAWSAHVRRVHGSLLHPGASTKLSADHDSVRMGQIPGRDRLCVARAGAPRADHHIPPLRDCDADRSERDVHVVCVRRVVAHISRLVNAAPQGCRS
jgi:hypothetical protein